MSVVSLVTSLLLLSAIGTAAAAQEPGADADIGSDYGELYQAQCAVCHGEHLEGAAQGAPLVGFELKHGDSVVAISDNIANGFPAKGMPEWSRTLSAEQIKSLALYILETRQGFSYEDFNYSTAFEIPETAIATERHTFRLETVIDGLDPLPFSIAPLPDGRILLTEKKRGLSIIDIDGNKSAYIEGTPHAYDDSFILSVEQEWGHGWLLDVALHPDYTDNGWVYLHHGDRCTDCPRQTLDVFGERGRPDQPVSMNRLVRGRIREGKWVDEEVIWEAERRFYGPAPDIGAGGRIAFDGKGHVFLSVGLGIDNHKGIQDLGTPWGKIHRVYDDGRIPLDNPYMETAGAYKSMWTVGHRSPQGLEYRHETGDLWGTEHGPRGGDEFNRLLPGRNYGWPLYSRGMNYDGTPVAYGTQLGIEFDLEDIEQPVVDLTPSPAVSSFIFYDGDAFPAWRGNAIVGSLKARELYRFELDGNEVVHRETLLSGLARFRDIEVAPDGTILLLLESNHGGQIVRMVNDAGDSGQDLIAGAED